jgi:predicted cobalt transporter CbtA
MIKSLLVRGMAVGVVAGLLAFGFGKVFGEPQVDRAIAFETQMDAAKDAAVKADAGIQSQDMAAMPGMKADADANGHDHGDEALVSRHVQSTWGLLTGTLVYGGSFGGLLALVYAFALGRIGGVGPRGLAALLALAGFIAIVLVPDLKYPANPPAVGLPETIGSRTGFFLSMLVISIGAMISAVLVGRGYAAKHGLWNGALAGGALFIVIVGIAQLLLPEINEVPSDFPAVVLWRFRIASLGIQAVLWTTMGLLFGYLTERSLQQERRVLRPAH